MNETFSASVVQLCGATLSPRLWMRPLAICQLRRQNIFHYAVVVISLFLLDRNFTVRLGGSFILIYTRLPLELVYAYVACDTPLPQRSLLSARGAPLNSAYVARLFIKHPDK